MKTQKHSLARLCAGALLAATVTVGGGAATTAVADPTDNPFPVGQTAPGGLRILLTNDDGIDAPGIRAMYDALTAPRAGGSHQVVVVAPADNQSGSGARYSPPGTPLIVDHVYPGVASITGTPVDAVEFGLENVFFAFPPDLVISGINNGENVGAGTIHSGTIGAAVTAINDGIPAIAVSRRIDATPTVEEFRDGAQLVVDLVDELIEQSGFGRADVELLAPGLGLSINVPARVAGRVELVQTGRGGFDIEFSGDLPPVGQQSQFAVGAGFELNEPVGEPVDTLAFYVRNSVTVTPITGNYDRGELGELQVSENDMLRDMIAGIESGADAGDGSTQQ